MEKQLGSREAARKLLETGVKLNRTDAVLLQALGVLESEDGNLKLARSYFRKSARVNPRHMAAWQAWAIMEDKADNAEGARELFQRALWCEPQVRVRVIRVRHVDRGTWPMMS